jgi:hypothetical protein
VDGDAWFGCDAVGDACGEFDSVDGERVAGGNCGSVGFGEEDAAGSAHLLLEEPGGCVFRLGLEGVGADEFGEVAGLVGFGGAGGAHLVEVNLAASFGGLEGSFRASEAAANDLDSSGCQAAPPSLFSVKFFELKSFCLHLTCELLISSTKFGAKSSIHANYLRYRRRIR